MPREGKRLRRDAPFVKDVGKKPCAMTQNCTLLTLGWGSRVVDRVRSQRARCNTSSKPRVFLVRCPGGERFVGTMAVNLSRRQHCAPTRPAADRPKRKWVLHVPSAANIGIRNSCSSLTGPSTNQLCGPLQPLGKDLHIS